MIRRTSLARLFAAAVVAAAVATPANAGLIPVSVSVQPEAGNFRWTYSVVLPSDMQLQAGDYFTIYDFGGYVNGSGGILSPFPDDSFAGFWEFSSSMTGPTPPLLDPTDNPAVNNLTWKYNGPTITGGGDSLGNFVAASLFDFDKKMLNSFTATNSRSSDNAIDSNITETYTPTNETIIPPTPGVPEPTTLALAGLGLPIIGVARWYRRRGAKA